MRQMIWAAAMVFLLSGCTTRVALKESLTVSTPDIKPAPIKSYELNKMHTAYIGQPIVKWQEAKLNNKKIYSADNIVAAQDFTLSGRYDKNWILGKDFKVSGKKGEAFRVIGSIRYEGNPYHLVAVKEPNKKENMLGMLFDPDGRIHTKTVTDEHFDTIMRSENAQLSPPDATFIVNSDTSIQDEIVVGLSHELIYGGINDVTMSLSYREYTPSDMARQAFYQNLVYKTSADTIRFRDFRIKVHEASNEKIVYTVLEDGL